MFPRRPHRSTSPRGPVPIVLCDSDGAELQATFIERWLIEAVAQVVADERSPYESITDCLAETFAAAALEYQVFGRRAA